MLNLIKIENENSPEWSDWSGWNQKNVWMCRMRIITLVLLNVFWIDERLNAQISNWLSFVTANSTVGFRKRSTIDWNRFQIDVLSLHKF